MLGIALEGTIKVAAEPSLQQVLASERRQVLPGPARSMPPRCSEIASTQAVVIQPVQPVQPACLSPCPSGLKGVTTGNFSEDDNNTEPPEPVLSPRMSVAFCSA